ncbi:MAG TPA: SLC13 family permease [Azospira sp.]|nr:SLC13 family permease [Azospira sp.]
MTPEQLARAISHAEQCHFPAGSTIFAPADAADRLYILLEGEVEITVGSHQRLLHARDMFGASAVVGHAYYGARTLAVTDCIVLAIGLADIKILTAQDNSLHTWAYETLLGLAHDQAKAGKPGKGQKEPEWQEIGGWALTLLCPALLLWLGLAQGLRTDIALFLAIATATLLMWLFNLVDEFIPGVFAIMAIMALDLAPPKIVLSGFTSDGFFMAMGVLALGVLIVTSGLSYRILLLLLKYFPDRQPWHNLGLVLVGLLLTPVVPVTNGRVALVKPILLDLIHSLHLARGGKAATLLASSAFGGVTILSAVILSSKSSNFVVFGLLPEQLRDQYQWLGWLLVAAVNGAILLAGQALLSWLLFRNHERPTVMRDALEIQLQVLGPLTRKEWGAIAGTLLFCTGVLTESIHKIKTPWLGMGLMFAFLALRLISKDEFRKRIDWALLLYLASLVGFGATFSYLGMDQWVSNQLGMLGAILHDNLMLFFLVLSLGMMAIRLVLPMSPAIAIAATILMPMASAQGISPWVVGFAILNLGEMWFFPFQSSQYLQLRETGQGPAFFDERRFLLFNGLMNVLKIAALYLSIPYWHSLGML